MKINLKKRGELVILTSSGLDTSIVGYYHSVLFMYYLLNIVCCLAFMCKYIYYKPFKIYFIVQQNILYLKRFKKS